MVDFFEYSFLWNALIAGSCIALVSSLIGYFVIARSLTFIAHNLPHIGFAGATVAVYAGIEAIWGLFASTTIAAIGVSFYGTKWREQNNSTALLTSFFLGIGLLFGSLSVSCLQCISSILLFGSILSINMNQVIYTAIICICIIPILGFLFRPLFFSTIDTELAITRGIPVKAISCIFLVLLALVLSLSVQLMGSLLVFTLLIGPAATAMRLLRKPIRAIIFAAGLSLLYVWISIILATIIGTIPVSFIISLLAFSVYLPVRLCTRS